MHSREQLKQSLKDHMVAVESAYRGVAGILDNPEYRTAACLLSIMEKQDEPAINSTVGKPAPKK